MKPDYILDVQHLCTEFSTRDGVLRAVNDVSLKLERGQVLGLVGESGSGKSVTGYSIMGLIDPPGRIASGKILFKGKNLVDLPERQFSALRGNRIAMIFQDPMMTLNPVLRVDTQLVETIYAHSRASRKDARRQAIEALEKVGIPSPEERMLAYPHQLSGGMRQRIAIAIALLHKPDLIIADEPTTALDVTIQAQILAEVQQLVRESGTALIWITHDLTVVAGLADEVAVMYAGKIVEQGQVKSVIEQPLHPYSAGLLGSLPSRNAGLTRLMQIPGMTPRLSELPQGCAFRTRCFNASSMCMNEPQLSHPAVSRSLRCFNPVGASV